MRRFEKRLEIGSLGGGRKPGACSRDDARRGENDRR